MGVGSDDPKSADVADAVINGYSGSSMHKGGLVKKDGVYKLKKGEYVLPAVTLKK